MTLIGRDLDLETSPFLTPGVCQAFWHGIAQNRLRGVMANAERMPYDDGSRLVFFADLHRGDNGRADAFAPNRDLFMHAMEHYWRTGFSYVEVGDGDELWKNRHFGDVRRAHGAVFDLLHRFHKGARLRLIAGNHDGRGGGSRDGLPVSEGLVLRQRFTGQELLVVHGHQADFKNDRLQTPLRLFAQHIWRHLQNHGLGTTLPEDNALDAARRIVRQAARWAHANQRAIEQKLMAWAHAMGQVVICGHTHRPSFAKPGEPSYFNTGSCIQPGYITGLEIAQGQIALVRWRAQETLGRGISYLREALAPQRSLVTLA